METMKELKERLNRVISQKDRYGDALAKILDAIRHGRYNGLFESGYRERKNEKGECPQGLKYADIRWGGCNKVLSCPTCSCPMTFEMRHLTEAYQRGLEVCEEQDSAKIPFNVHEIPKYEPRKYSYSVSKRWFAKEMIRIIQSMRIGTDNKDVGGSAALGKAYKRLVGFGMESIGMKRAWLEILQVEELAVKMGKMGKTDKEVEDWFEQSVEGFHHLRDAAFLTHKLFEKREKIDQMIRKAPSRAFRYLVLLSLLIFTEFDFAHDYPGADLGIYMDNFVFIGRLCLTAMKIKCEDRFAILEFVNSDDEADDFKMTPIAGE